MAAADVFDYARAAKEAVGCPLCGTAWPSQMAVDRFGYVLGVSACPSCELDYLNPRMTAEEYARFYREAYRQLLQDRYGLARVKHPREDVFAKRRGAQIGQIIRGRGYVVRSVVDVGGNTGLSARTAARRLGCSDDVTVIDPDRDALAEAASRGCQTIEGMIETLPAPARHWDLALCLLTADHWLHPVAALRWLRMAATYLWIDIIDVPIKMRLYPSSLRWKVDHPLNWTTASFQRALDRTGWAVQQMYVTQSAQRRKVERPSFLCVGV